MSIDTVRITVQAELKSTAWAEREKRDIDNRTGEIKRRFVANFKSDDDATLPRLAYFPEHNRVVSEVSLPKFVRGENFTLLSDEDITKGTTRMIEFIANTVGQHLPTAETWHVSRMDSCYAWLVGDDMQAYLGALAQMPVHGYTRRGYTLGDNTAPGFTWQAKSLRVNAYDKGLETQRPEAAGLLRLETQALNNSACKTAAKRCKVNQTVAELVTGSIGRREIAQWLKRIGMPSTIQTHAGLFDQLAKEFSPDDAASRWWFLEGFRRRGHGIKQIVSERTYQRRMTEAKKRGWLATSPGQELPGLTIRQTSNQNAVAPRVLLGATMPPLTPPPEKPPSGKSGKKPSERRSKTARHSPPQAQESPLLPFSDL